MWCKHHCECEHQDSADSLKARQYDLLLSIQNCRLTTGCKPSLRTACKEQAKRKERRQSSRQHLCGVLSLKCRRDGKYPRRRSSGIASSKERVDEGCLCTERQPSTTRGKEDSNQHERKSGGKSALTHVGFVTLALVLSLDQAVQGPERHGSLNGPSW